MGRGGGQVGRDAKKPSQDELKRLQQEKVANPKTWANWALEMGKGAGK